MERGFVRADRRIPRARIKDLLASEPRWVLVDDEEHRPVALLPAVDLLRAGEESEYEELDLLKIPAERRQVAPIYREADMEQARRQLADSGMEALYVERQIAPGITRIYGILTREQVEAAYRL
jgi:hypothetical protein